VPRSRASGTASRSVPLPPAPCLLPPTSERLGAPGHPRRRPAAPVLSVRLRSSWGSCRGRSGAPRGGAPQAPIFMISKPYSAFSSEPGAAPPGAVYGDSAPLSEPGATDTKPSTETTKPSANSVKPNRASRARGGSQERSWCCAGLRGFEAKTSRGNFEPRGGQSQNCEAQAIWPILVKKMVSKTDFLVGLRGNGCKSTRGRLEAAKPNAIFVDFGTSAKVP
jgi:hypothetical protein